MNSYFQLWHTTSKVFEFLDNELKPVMRQCLTLKIQIFLCKKKRDLKDKPKNTLFVTVDVTGLYPSISHEAELQTLCWGIRKKKGWKDFGKWFSQNGSVFS